MHVCITSVHSVVQNYSCTYMYQPKKDMELSVLLKEIHLFALAKV